MSATFKQQYLLMFGGSTEADFWHEFKRRNCMELNRAACDPRLPESALGYISQLQSTENEAVAQDAYNMIRRHMPEFKLWGLS